MDDDRPRLPLALALACPACAGGAILVVGTLLGATALAVKSALLATVALLVGMLWVRNAWRRRHET
jgi:hypothetical protein